MNFACPFEQTGFLGFLVYPLNKVQLTCKSAALAFYAIVKKWGGDAADEAVASQKAHEETDACRGRPTPSPTPPPTPPPSKPDGKWSGVFGDPHLSTFDRLRFDCQAAGEFVTVTSLENPSFQIQERFTSIGSDFCSQASVSTAVAIADVDTPTIQISTPRTSVPSSLNSIGNCQIDLFVDGTEMMFGDDIGSSKVEVALSGSRISIVHTETFVSLDIAVSESSSFGCHFLVQVFIPNVYRLGETILGLLGTPNGDRSDDWRLPDGTVVAAPTSTEESIFSTSYNYCVNWCIRDEANSIFTYRDGESFNQISGCDENYADDIEESIADPPPELVILCGSNVYCLVDGLCGNLDDALRALEDEETIENEQEAANPSPSSMPSESLQPSMHPTIVSSSAPSDTPSDSGMPSEKPSVSSAPSQLPSLQPSATDSKSGKTTTTSVKKARSSFFP